MSTSSRSVRWQITLLLIVFISPVILSAMFYLKRDTWQLNTLHYGQLLSPPLTFNHIKFTGGEPRSEINNKFQGQWLMMYVAPDICELDCDMSLYKMRQVRLALGKNMERINRLVIDISPPMNKHLKDLLKNVYQKTPILFTSFYPKALTPGHLYIVDPLGNIILDYSPQNKPKHLLKDMKRLLKASRIG